jgi:hypothetical protein
VLLCRARPLSDLRIRTHGRTRCVSTDWPTVCRHRTAKCDTVSGALLTKFGHMNDAHNHRAADRVRVELIEADVDMAFGLVDDALEEFRDGNVDFARSALGDAEKALSDIAERLGQIDAERRAPFGPLVDELRKAIRAAQSECA